MVWAATARVLRNGMAGGGPAAHLPGGKPLRASWTQQTLCDQLALDVGLGEQAHAAAAFNDWQVTYPRGSITCRASISVVPGETTTTRVVINVLTAGSVGSPGWSSVWKSQWSPCASG